MNKIYLFAILTGVFLICSSGSVSADWVKDTGINDSTIEPQCDLLWSKVLFFPPPNTQFDEEGETIAKYVKLGVVMDDDASLPGILQFNFDLDNNPATGAPSPGESMGFRLCNNYGFDLGINIVLRDQSPTGSIANSFDGLGHPLRGKWFACYWLTTEVYLVDHGRLGGYCVDRFDLPNETCTDDRDCYKLPWRRIVENYLAHPDRSWVNPGLNESYVRTFCNKPGFEVLAFLDPVFTDEDDYMTFPDPPDLPLFDLRDIMPNECTKYESECGNMMCMQFPQDDNQDWDDVFIFLDDWGRNADNNPCPACLPWP